MAVMKLTTSSLIWATGIAHAVCSRRQAPLATAAPTSCARDVDCRNSAEEGDILEGLVEGDGNGEDHERAPSGDGYGHTDEDALEQETDFQE